MGKRATTLESKSKHLTKDERQAAENAEAGYMPNRQEQLKYPRFLGKDDKQARAYWRDILKRMDGLAILDVLDTEMLGIYCQMLVRRDEVQAQIAAAMSDDARLDGKDLASLEGKMQSLERNLLSYAEKLGLTPGGRVALARRAATQERELNPMFD